MTPTARQLDASGILINIWEWPAESRPILLLIHGGRDQARSWDFIAERLAGHFHIVAPDLRGHGDSAWSHEGQYDLADFVADLAGVLVSLPAPVLVVGHSLGGNIALRLAAIYPDRINRVVAIEGLELPLTRDLEFSDKPLAGRFLEWLDQRQEIVRRRLPIYASVEAAAHRMASEFPKLGRAMIDHLALHSVRPHNGGFTWKFDNRTRLRPPIDSDSRDFDTLLTSIICPTLLIYGGASWIPAPQPRRLALLQDHRVRRFDRAGHWVHHDQPDLFAKQIAEFLLERGSVDA